MLKQITPKKKQTFMALTLCTMTNLPTDRPLRLNDIVSLERLLDVNVLVISSRPCVDPGYYEYSHSTLWLVLARKNEATSLPCVATRNGGGRDPGGWNTPLWPLLHLDGRSNGSDSINRLITSCTLTDLVNTVQVCSCCFLTEILGIQMSSAMRRRGGKEGMVGHSKWHIEEQLYCFYTK